MRPYPAHQTFHCELAWLPPGRVAADVTVVVDGARIVAVTEGGPRPAGAQHLQGLVLPGLANAHSHAFHRALRGRTHAPTAGQGSFWTWRNQMYSVAARLDPDSYLTLARAVYAEMALAGITSVGEFHYLHHGPDGRPYDDTNAMGHALVAAAHDAGLHVALLDTCYLTGGVDRPLEGVQRRFGDRDAQAWASRVELLHAAYADRSDVVIGAGLHSVRAVPADQMPPVVAWASAVGAPLHAHVSEQRAENDDCLRRYGVTPTRLLHDQGVLGARSTAVHATHLTPDDIGLLGSSATSACFCPTTERDLADGIGPAVALLRAGAPLTLGSDSHAVIDLLEEARAVELDARLASERRGHFSVPDLLRAATSEGHDRLGFTDAGRVEVGRRADLVAVRLDSVRTSGAVAGTAAETVVFAATAADVTDVVSSGRHVVEDGRHVLGDVGLLLRNAIHDLL
ncbi:MAG: formimidoylglutamate deiminase [Actinomycetes bacterium]